MKIRGNIEWTWKLPKIGNSLIYTLSDVIAEIGNALRLYSDVSKGIDGGIVESVRLVDDTIQIRWRSSFAVMHKRLARKDPRFHKLGPKGRSAPPPAPVVEDEPFAPLPEAGRAETEIKEAAMEQKTEPVKRKRGRPKKEKEVK